MTDLLPCPFCGGHPHASETITDGCVSCQYCKARICYNHCVGAEDGLQAASDAWNRRAALDHAAFERAVAEAVERERVRLRKLTPAMIQAALDAHYGKGHNPDGVSMTVRGIDYTFTDAFRRMWKGAIAAAIRKGDTP